jgi:hypothetical protein
MASADKHEFDDQYLVRYLLGSLPAEEAERLDELSITNDEFAWRLREIENDLVDAYVRSQLKGEALNQFESFYLSSARRRQRVEFAEGLRRFQAARADRPAEQSTGASSFLSRWLAVPRSKLQLGLAATAFLVLLAAGYLFFDNARLRREIDDARVQHLSGEQRTRELEKQLSEQRASGAEMQKKVGPDLNQLKTVSLLLPPPTRGPSSIPAVTLRPGTDLVVLLLTLESADFPRYRVTLRDPVTNGSLWSSPDLEPVSAGGRKAVSAGFRADLLKQQNYIAEVVGLQDGNGSHIVGDYPFRVVVRLRP